MCPFLTLMVGIGTILAIDSSYRHFKKIYLLKKYKNQPETLRIYLEDDIKEMQSTMKQHRLPFPFGYNDKTNYSEKQIEKMAYDQIKFEVWFKVAFLLFMLLCCYLQIFIMPKIIL